MTYTADRDLACSPATKGYPKCFAPKKRLACQKFAISGQDRSFPVGDFRKFRCNGRFDHCAQYFIEFSQNVERLAYLHNAGAIAKSRIQRSRFQFFNCSKTALNFRRSTSRTFRRDLPLQKQLNANCVSYFRWDREPCSLKCSFLKIVHYSIV